MTPNLDATGQWWVRALAQFNFKLEYQKGCDNTMADMLNQVTTWLDPDTVRSILDGVALGAVHWAKVHDPAVVEGNHNLEQEVHVAAGCMLVQMHVTYWGWSPKRGSNVEYSLRPTEGRGEDRLEGTSGRTHLQQGKPTYLMELTEFCNSLGSLISVLNAQGWGWRSATICSP